jgi:tRNA A-37 threonylcarbamoyl transferase component Bud32
MALQAGQLFGNYRIVRLLGEGGFGEVYLAENPLIERRAAVKVLHTALARDAELVRRFLNEARAASAIRHRNIIEVFDAGVTAEGAPYILMEFLEGVSLQRRLTDKGRLALAQAMEIARQAGSALVAAHAAGIVHRDLKPENLFLVSDAAAPGGERVKILDFGIAKIKRAGGTGGTMRTQAGLIMGSPAYMSPEQCKDSADVDLRSDIYSFATIMYEMLAGRTPYVAASGTEMLVMHLTATPTPVGELVGDVPAHVEAAITRALSRTRDDRFDSMEAFLGALRGEAGAGLVGRLSPSGELLAVGGDRVPGVERTVAVPSITTFSRATGEVGTTAGDDVLLQASRTRRWPIFAVAGAAVAGLVLVLLVRPSHESAARPTPATLRVEVADAAAARGANGGAAPTELTRAPSAARPPDAGVPSVVNGVRPSPKRRVRASATPPPIDNRKTENPWVVH